MHNSPEKNAEFQLAWCETNLRYLRGYEDQTDPETVRKIAFMESEIARVETLLKAIKLSNWKFLQNSANPC